jgi:hypothetical protein
MTADQRGALDRLAGSPHGVTEPFMRWARLRPRLVSCATARRRHPGEREGGRQDAQCGGAGNGHRRQTAGAGRVDASTASPQRFACGQSPASSS